MNHTDRRPSEIAGFLDPKIRYAALMKLGIPLLIVVALMLPVEAQTKRRSLLDSDPEVVYLDLEDPNPIELKVIKAAPVFSDKLGKHRLGTLKANQTVRVEALTDKIYRVRGKGMRDGIAGWVAPWAFSSKDPEFVAKLKGLYERQMQVKALIEANQVAIGMTLDEVAESRGKPVKTTVRRSEKGQSGTWEYSGYEEIKHYITRTDPTTGNIYRQLSHVTQEEKSKTVIEFEDDVVTAIEESEDRKGAKVRIIVPPLTYGW